MPPDRIDGGPLSTRDWLAEWTSIGLRLPVLREPIAPVRMQRVAQDLRQRRGDLNPKAPTKYELDETVRRLAAAWKKTRSLRDVEPRHLRRAPWAFFHPQGQPRAELGRDEALVRA